MQQATAVNKSGEEAHGQGLRGWSRKNHSLRSGWIWSQLQPCCSKVIQGASQVRYSRQQINGPALVLQRLVGRKGRKHEIIP